MTELTTCGGCAAKWGAAGLGELIDAVGTEMAPGLLVGLAPSDDAAVLRVSDDVALVSTIDFFPPLVDDPADYGAIAASNACSDVFAMGGDVVLALNVAAFPEELPSEVIREIFRAASQVVAAAGGVVAGGHTIRSAEPIYGLAVQGVIVPGQQFTTGGARPGDALVLSKPLGSGLAMASGDPQLVSDAVASMRRLNRDAAGALRRVRADVHAVTDVTGFGLLGHAWEVAAQSDARLVIDAKALPLLPGVAEVIAAGIRTGGDARNRVYVDGHVTLAAGSAAAAVGFDPQTSGGLFAAVAPSAVHGLRAEGFVPVGTVEAGPAAVVLG